MKGTCTRTEEHTALFILYTGVNKDAVEAFLQDYNAEIFAYFESDDYYLMCYSTFDPGAEPPVTARITLGTVIVRDITTGALEFMDEDDFFSKWGDVHVCS